MPDSPKERKRLGLGPHDPTEYHFTQRRPLTPDERRHAEDRQVLEAVATACAATLRALARRFLDSVSAGNVILDWGGRGEDAARCARLGPVLARLRSAGLVRVVGRRWTITRAGFRVIGWQRWERHRRDVALTLVEGDRAPRRASRPRRR